MQYTKIALCALFIICDINMRDTSTLKLNYVGTMFSIGIIYFIIKLQYDGEIQILDYIEFLLPILFILINLSLFRVTVNSNGISKSLFFPNVKYNVKSWSDIKHFINVTEVTKDKNGKEERQETIWFVDFNDKVCLRIQKNNLLSSKNMKKIISIIKQREVEYPDKLVFRSPFWYRIGLWKVDYSKKENTKL